MIEDPAFPIKEALLAAYKDQIETHGGSHGVRDEGGLDAALARAEQIRAYAETPPDLFQLAAAICYGITRIRHPFVDGNKRMGFIALHMTLWINGFYLDATEADAAKIMIGVSEGSVSENDLVKWVSDHSFERDQEEG